MSASEPIVLAFITEEDRVPVGADSQAVDTLTMDSAVRQLLDKRSASAKETHPEPDKVKDVAIPEKLMIEKNIDSDDDDDDDDWVEDEEVEDDDADEDCWREASVSQSVRGHARIVM
jgi:hypothetical protein